MVSPIVCVHTLAHARILHTGTLLGNFVVQIPPFFTNQSPRRRIVEVSDPNTGSWALGRFLLRLLVLTYGLEEIMAPKGSVHLRSGYALAQSLLAFPSAIRRY
jgi:hypothetical protein